MKKNITPTDIRTWSMLGQRGTVLAIAVDEIAAVKDNLKVLTADLALLSGLMRFANAHPDKFMNVGIAEQNMIGVAAGLAMAGKCVFATTYSSFIVVRSLEHVRQHLSYLGCNVKLIGSSAGVVAAKSGVSHWATEDIAFSRALPNMIVLSPADSLEAYKFAHLAAQTDKPVYLRLSGGLNCPVVHRQDIDVEIGKAIKLRQGERVAVMATGLMVNNALKAASLLDQQGVGVSVYDFHTIKPIDRSALDEIFRSYELIVTVEQHNVIGGFGSAVAEVKAGYQNAPRQVMLGFNDMFTAAGSQNYIWGNIGLLPEQIAERIRRELTNA